MTIQSTRPSGKRRDKMRHYEWALEIMKAQQENSFKHYNYREDVLNYIRARVPSDLKDETLED